MTQPVNHHPDFEYRRYWLKLTFDETKKDSVVVKLKNPSSATDELLDKKFIMLKIMSQ